MSVVVQKTYRPTLAPGVPGMIADETNAATITRVCETSTGIPFGVAVSQGSGDNGCIIGGSAFLGVSVRDVTLALTPVDPLSDSANTLDSYGEYVNVGIMTTGHIWVTAEAPVSPNDALYFDATTGLFSNSASGASASGSITFTSNPTDGQTLLIGAQTVTFKAAGSTVSSLYVGIKGTLGDTVTELASVLNASANSTINTCTYEAWPPSPGGAGQGSGAYQLRVSHDAVGTAGNSFGLTAGTTTGATASGADLAGGTASATAVTGGYWVSSAIAGDIAKVSLGIQR